MANYNLIESTENAALVTGTSNSDSIIVGGNNVTVKASGGGDIIRLNGGKETTSVNGGKYDSTIWEDTDITNFVYGEGGNDSIYFNQSHANANGGSGNDYFHVSNRDANSGYYYYPRKLNDITISGGAGKDTVEIYPIGYESSEDNNSINFTIADFSNEDALFINEYTARFNYTYSDSESKRRVITQRVENGNVIISDNSSVTSSGNDTVSKNLTPNFNITLQGVSDISEVADAEYFIYDTYYRKFTQHSTLGELFGVKSGSKTSTTIDDEPEDSGVTTTTTETGSTTSTNTPSSEPKVSSGSKNSTTSTDTTTDDNSTETSTKSSSGGTTIYNGPVYINNGTINNTKVINNVNNTYTYNGGDKTINNYVEGQVVQLKSDYQGIDVNGNSFLVKSSSGAVEIQNARDKFIGYSGSDNNVVAYSYLASGGGTVDGRGKNQAEIMIGGDNANNQILAGSGGSSLWGGNGGADTLTGGAGYDEFFYAIGSGNDVVKNAGDNDVVNLLGVSLEQITYAEVNYSDINIGFTDGGKLQLQGQSATGFKLEGVTYTANRSTGEWSTK